MKQLKANKQRTADIVLAIGGLSNSKNPAHRQFVKPLVAIIQFTTTKH
jgi:hypothetical protein